MEYAIQLLMIFGGFTWLGMWLHNRYGMPQAWVAVFALLGAVLGIYTLYTRANTDLKNKKITIHRKPGGKFVDLSKEDQDDGVETVSDQLRRMINGDDDERK